MNKSALLVIVFTQEQRSYLVDKIQRYMNENMDHLPGNIETNILIDFMVEEVGRLCYNQAIKDAQKFMQERITEMYLLTKEANRS